ncbi:hypothetical protein [Morganella morganii]|uniref:hypothetical protein n=1 Tax=Morganella morganii TaxID=582 RepID=UPI000A9EB917|nr:hypothetical protein [Morganella morganii]
MSSEMKKPAGQTTAIQTGHAAGITMLLHTKLNSYVQSLAPTISQGFSLTQD